MADEAPPPKGWKVEYAKSGRAACKTCKNSIGKDDLRIARVVQSTKFDGVMTVWHHSKCILSKPGRFQSLDDVEGAHDLRWEDQQMLRKYVEDGDTGKDDDAENGDVEAGTREYAVENAKSGRSTCKTCNEKIAKGEVRISTMVSTDRGQVPAWRHAKCFIGLGWLTRPLAELPGWDTLSTEDQKAIQSLAKPIVANSNLTSKPSAKGSKRKAGAVEENSVPPGKEKVPVSKEKVLASKEKVPASKGKVPASKEKVLASKGKVPANKERQSKLARKRGSAPA